MIGDAMWYEAAQVVGITNALNVAADTLGVLGALDETAAPAEVRALFADIREFYQAGDMPLGFRFIAHDVAYASRRMGGHQARVYRPSALAPSQGGVGLCRVHDDPLRLGRGIAPLPDASLRHESRRGSWRSSG